MRHSPSEQIGLEMTLLRMIAFHPDTQAEKKTLKSSQSSNSINKEPPKEKIQGNSLTKDKLPIKVMGERIQAIENLLNVKSQGDWEKIITELGFTGAAKMLVKNTVFDSLKDHALSLTLSDDFVNLLTQNTQSSIEKILNEAYPQITLVINPGSTNGSSLSQKESIKSEEKRKQTESEFLNDDGLKELQEVFNSQVDVKSIKSIKESDNV